MTSNQLFVNYIFVMLIIYLWSLFIYICIKFGTMPLPRTHGMALESVCCACWRKVGSGGRKVDESMSLLVREHIFSEYSVDSEIHPISICNSCRVVLNAKAKVK